MTLYSNRSIQFCYYDDGRDNAGQMAADEAWAIEQGMTNVETLHVIYRTFSRPEAKPAEWWETLKPGDRVRPNKSNAVVLRGDGSLYKRYNPTDAGGAEVIFSVWEPGLDKPAARVCIFNRGDLVLWISTNDIAKA